MTDTSYLHQIKLPGITLPGNIFLAPMAGFTDRAMREVCVGFGADLTYSEMVSAEGLVRNNKKTTVLMDHDPTCEKFFAIQIFTGDPESAYQAVKMSLTHKPILIDLNCGCPVPKVIKNGAGSALMRSPEKIAAIVKAMKTAIAEADASGTTAISVKLRTGWDRNEITYLEAAEAAQKAGAALIALHGRTRKQGYSGLSDTSAIKTLKENSSVPIIGSGDIFQAADAFLMLDSTGCDGVMVARGAIGNPFLFEQIKTSANKNSTNNISAQMRLETAKKQLALAIHYLGEKRACKEMKKHICAYTKGLQGGASLRNRIVHAETSAEYLTNFADFLSASGTNNFSQ
jgi:tRNA-dihydrouridine synthase B